MGTQWVLPSTPVAQDHSTSINLLQDLWPQDYHPYGVNTLSSPSQTPHLQPALAEQPAPSRSQQILQTILPWQILSGEKESSHLPTVCPARAGRQRSSWVRSALTWGRATAPRCSSSCGHVISALRSLYGRSLGPALILLACSWAKCCPLNLGESHSWSSRCFPSALNPGGISSRRMVAWWDMAFLQPCQLVVKNPFPLSQLSSSTRL